ncbi:MAG TPA: TlpA disulfide reductase family protein [Terriglobales bacterium]|nr:TlpA disulfide reductase family protein [Terriglobales bacterium]
MSSKALAVAMLAGSILVSAQTSSGPADAKAQKTYAEAEQALHAHRYFDALDKFKKANKQDKDQCVECLKQVVSLATSMGDFKAADSASRELIAMAKDPQDVKDAHYQRGRLLLQEGVDKKKSDVLAESDTEFKAVLAVDAKDARALFSDGLALARLNQDAAAQADFKQFADIARPGSVDRTRALRFAERPELARERMAPAFALTAEDGRRISMDDLHGKVVLLDFWATWCGPCREALPHMKRIAQKFKGEPLVILSVSLDSDDQKWKNFITQNEMTWAQYRDGNFDGPMAKLFGVRAIPHTFTIDADGVLQDEKIGDASIEGKLKKLIAQAQQLQEARAEQRASAK